MQVERRNDSPSEFTKEEMQMIKEDIAAWKEQKEVKTRIKKGDNYKAPQYRAIFVDTDQTLKMHARNGGEDDAS